ncbi:hypothetical protein O181_060477 [Austropuccinia psidii MF-1]|uniref:Uncharacterized protein n=1 Tax=Austropuccinia psidii MF-1 TaxID=1389203 RepID=A0A9Q3EIR3_9BASI|nr:hypothetical protein [Austropuccinia psidii MF-1]
MSPVYLRDLGFQRNQPEDREGMSRSRRPEGGHLGHSGGCQDIEGNHTHESLLNMKTTNRHTMRWKIAIQEYRAYEPEVSAKISINFMEIDRKKNFRFSEWAPESGTLDSGNTDSEGTETPILGISSSELHNEFFSAVLKSCAKHKQCGILLQLL